MWERYIPACALCLLVASSYSAVNGQSLRPDLEKVSRTIESYIHRTRPGWNHETVPPATPPGQQPSPVVVIHFWTSEKCLTAEVIIDGASSGKQPVSCHIKLAIDQSSSASAARTRLSDFVQQEPSASPVQVGDKGYVWRGSDVVFIKDKFTFWLSGVLDLRVGDFTKNREFLEKLAKELADNVGTP